MQPYPLTTLVKEEKEMNYDSWEDIGQEQEGERERNETKKRPHRHPLYPTRF